MRINGPSGSGSEGASSKGVENHDPATPPAAGVPLRGAGDGVRATILAAVTAEPPATMMGRGSIVDGDLSITSSADLAQLAEVEVIKGDLYIDRRFTDAIVEVPKLHTIEGNLVIRLADDAAEPLAAEGDDATVAMGAVRLHKLREVGEIIAFRGDGGSIRDVVLHVDPRGVAVNQLAQENPGLFQKLFDAAVERAFPDDGVVHVMRTGSVMRTPFRVDDADALFIHGTADLAALDGLLAEKGLRAVPIAPGRGQVSVAGINYKDSEVGPYAELVVQVLAAKRDVPQGEEDGFGGWLEGLQQGIGNVLGDDGPGVGMALLKLHVDRDEPLEGLITPGGFPKTKADIRVDVDREGGRGVHVRLDGQEVIDIRLDDDRALLPTSPYLDYAIVTPHKIWGRAVIAGQSGAGALDEGDSVRLNPESEVGRLLTDVGFEPKLWNAIPQLKMAVGAVDDGAARPVDKLARLALVAADVTAHALGAVTKRVAGWFGD